MKNINFTSKKLKGRGFSSAPLMNNYNKSVNTKEEQNGRSMIEMLGVLAIIGVLSVGGIAGYSKAMMKYRTNKTIEQVTLLMTNIRSFFGPKGDFYGASNEDVYKKAKLVPDEMLDMCVNGYGDSYECIKHAFGNEIQVFEREGKTSTSTGSDAIVFLIYDLPQEACIEIATMDWRANSGNSIINLTINGISAAEALSQFTDDCTTNARVVCAKDMPMSIDKAAAACSSDENYIAIKFY